jgi:hypothetical protein
MFTAVVLHKRATYEAIHYTCANLLHFQLQMLKTGSAENLMLKNSLKIIHNKA